MTIGEKIKYLRSQAGITQGKLAELSEIHPVSIRKYETNKMQPQPAQLEKIATALGVSYNALSGIDNNGLRLETSGDLMGVLMVLCKSNFLEISGERGEDLSLIDYTVNIKFNPLLAHYMELLDIRKDKQIKLSLKEVMINIKGYRMFSDLLKWEKMNFMYQKSLESYRDNPSEEIQVALNEILETKEKIELELQRPNNKLQIN